MIDFAKLSAPFPASAVRWRSQSLTNDGTKALALAYIDARDVMHRLDDVCGPENWQDACAETAKGRLISTISIRCGDDWIAKTDGAGDTDVEGEKGAISDAFKRAAVKWGIGRYLYDVEAVWAECETYEKNGKRYFKKWTARGEAQLAAALNKVIPHVAPRKADPDMISGDDKDVITTLGQAAGVSLQTICERSNVSSLDELTAEKAAAVIKKLRLTIQDNERKAA